MKDNKSMAVRLSPFMILSAGILWGTMGIFVRRYNAFNISSLSIVTIRGVVTTVVLGLWLLLFNREALKIKFRDIWVFIGSGVFSIVFFNYCYFRTIVETSMALAAVLLYTAPIFVMIMSFFLFKEGINTKKIMAVILTFFGCVLVTGILESEMHITPVGLLIGLGAGLGYALYSIFGRFAIQRGYSSMTITFYTFVFSLIGCIPLCSFKEMTRVATDGNLLVFSLIYGVLSTVLPYILYTKGLEHTENGRASILASVEPLVATLLGFFIYSETLSPLGIAGIILVFAGIIISNI